jgi:hypothetical protein
MEELLRKRQLLDRQQRSGVTREINGVREAEEILLDPEAKSDYDKENGFWTTESIKKVRRFRARQPKIQRQVQSVLTVARRKARRGERVDLPRRQQRHVPIGKYTTTAASRKWSPGTVIQVCRRTRAEKKKDRRLSGVVLYR